MSDSTDKRLYRVAVFALDAVALDTPQDGITRHNYTVSFEPYRSERRLDEYDVVIVPQGIFETMNRSHSFARGRTLSVSSDRNELDKREKELDRLLSRGGVVCFVLTDRFIDTDTHKECLDTDLPKRFLRFPGVSRKNFSQRIVSGLTPLWDELSQFVELYGAASSVFYIVDKGIRTRRLIKYNGTTVSFVVNDSVFFIPAMLPDNNLNRLREFITLLIEAIISLRKKLSSILPSWIAEFEFTRESVLKQNLSELEAEAETARLELKTLEEYKSVLTSSGVALVNSAKNLLVSGFGFSVSDVDEGREDLQITDGEGRPLVYIEVKGVNGGVKREYISQTAFHRDRSSVPSDFPTVLLINTHNRRARSVAEKDRPVPVEQVEYAKQQGIVILRTLDLLLFLRLFMEGGLSREEFLGLLRGEAGWRFVDLETGEIGLRP